MSFGRLGRDTIPPVTILATRGDRGSVGRWDAPGPRLVKGGAAPGSGEPSDQTAKGRRPLAFVHSSGAPGGRHRDPEGRWVLSSVGRRALVSDDGCTCQAELYRLGTSCVCFRCCLFHKRLPFPSEPGTGQPFLLSGLRGWSYVHIARTRPLAAAAGGIRAQSRKRGVSPRCLVPSRRVSGAPSAPGRWEAWMTPGLGVSSGLCTGTSKHAGPRSTMTPPSSRDCLTSQPAGGQTLVGSSWGGEGLVSLALAELEDWPGTPSLDLIPAFSSWLFPPSLLLLPPRKRPFLAEFPAVQLQRDPKRPEGGGRPDVARDLRPLRWVDPVETMPQDGLQNPVPDRGGPRGQECDRLLCGLRAAGPLLRPA